MHLTCDAVTGVPFWTAMGSRDTGEYSTDNGMEIYEKALRHNCTDGWKRKAMTKATAIEIAD